MSDAPEFSRPFPLDRVGAGWTETAVTATEAECSALAVRLGVPALAALTCRFRLRRDAPDRVLAEATLVAKLTRECVITLDLFEAEQVEAFTVIFVPAGQENDDDPESIDELPYEGSAIDLGEAAAEQLALALDPYPHKPGATLPDEAEAPSASPFAALARRRGGT
jgi:uncharacterized metal-binding protein YceD (DUF177 family)